MLLREWHWECCTASLATACLQEAGGLFSPLTFPGFFFLSSFIEHTFFSVMYNLWGSMGVCTVCKRLGQGGKEGGSGVLKVFMMTYLIIFNLECHTYLRKPKTKKLNLVLIVAHDAKQKRHYQSMANGLFSAIARCENGATCCNWHKNKICPFFPFSLLIST